MKLLSPRGQLIRADERQALKQLRRDITRPALTFERVQRDTAEQAVLKLKTPWRDGTPCTW